MQTIGWLNERAYSIQSIIKKHEKDPQFGLLCWILLSYLTNAVNVMIASTLTKAYRFSIPHFTSTACIMLCRARKLLLVVCCVLPISGRISVNRTTIIKNTNIILGCKLRDKATIIYTVSQRRICPVITEDNNQKL